MLAEYFAGVRESLILLPKKNGKSTILAALGIFHLLTTPDADCIIVAASREQAEIILKAARGFIRRSPVLDDRLEVRKREIEYERLGGILKVRASDVDTVDGWIGTLGFIDELHRHKSPDLYGVIRDGLGPLQGRMITISTAGDDHDSPLGQLRASAYSLAGMQRRGAHRFARNADFAMHEWALEPDEDRDDLKIVKKANPASWQTVAELRKRQKSPSMKPWQWARFACGVWQAGEQGAISEIEWKACEDTAVAIPAAAKSVAIGIDLGWKWDTTAIVPVALGEEETILVGGPVLLEPPRDGSSLDDESIKAELREMYEQWPKATFVLDPEADGEQLAQWISRELGAKVVTYSQKPSPMALAAQRLSEAIATRRLRQPGHPKLTRHVLSAAAKAVGEGWRFVKPKRSGLYIDGAIALAIGVSVLVAPQEKPRPRIEILS